MYCRAAQTEEKGGGWNKLAQETVKRANHEMHDELNINPVSYTHLTLPTIYSV